MPAAQAGDESVVLRASRILDGKGGVLENRDVVGGVAGSRRSCQVAAHVTTALTVLPGYIDTHVHISSRAGLD